MGSPEKINCFKSVGTFAAYFSIPNEHQDWPYSRLCHFTDRRILWMRPIGKESKMTSVYLTYIHDDIPTLRQANAVGDRLKQKEAFAELYNGLGWETPRVIEQMMKAENFYSDELVQVKLQKWSVAMHHHFRPADYLGNLAASDDRSFCFMDSRFHFTDEIGKIFSRSAAK